MRLKSVYISEYKNLKDFNLSFDGESYIDLFVGRNASGKSNLLECLVGIFSHVDDYSSSRITPSFNYIIEYEIEGGTQKIKWENGLFFLNDAKKGQKTFGRIPLPENILIYYSGHNKAISDLINIYEKNFMSKIRGANIEDGRTFMGIGPEYKSQLLITLLLQPTKNCARKYVTEKLGIKSMPASIEITLSRPKFADSRLKKIGLKEIEEFDNTSHFWGADGITSEYLQKLVSCVKGEFKHSNVYDASKDEYLIPVDVKLYRKAFKKSPVIDQFQLLDNLKTLGMLTKLGVELTLDNRQKVSIEHFSDGQFQSVYIFSIAEIFKTRQCITLLDEPDSFLHPEWQFQFLQQVLEISEEATETNHILMSTHSASTIARAEEATINLFDFEKNKVVVNKVGKSDVIKSLSAGLISFTEAEAQLSIRNMLRNTQDAVLFTEGVSDEIILETAWGKLFPNEERNFIIQNAFDCNFLKNMFSREDILHRYQNRKMFALFDFDDAFDMWNGLKSKEGSELLENDPMKGMTKQLKNAKHFASLLPVPDDEKLKRQVLKPDGTLWGKGADCYISIEHMFYGHRDTQEYFREVDKPGGGVIVEFTGNKTKFSERVVPSLPVEAFEIFRPFFELVKAECAKEN